MSNITNPFLIKTGVDLLSLTLRKSNRFQRLEDMLSFFNKKIPFINVNPYFMFYNLRSSMVIEFNGKQYNLELLGTQHITTDDNNPCKSQKEAIDSFLSGIPEGSLILTEQGCDNLGRTSNHIKSILIREDKDSEETEIFEKDELHKAFGDMDYAANLAVARRIHVSNMDIADNPQAIDFCIQRLGLDNTILEYKHRSSFYFRDPCYLNSWIKSLFTSQDVSIEYDHIASLTIPDLPKSHSEKGLKNELREEYMTEEVFSKLTEDHPLYVIAQTNHTKEIIRRIAEKSERVVSLSAQVRYVPEVRFDLKKLIDHYFRTVAKNT